jgi:hypothetical protein
MGDAARQRQPPNVATSAVAFIRPILRISPKTFQIRGWRCFYFILSFSLSLSSLGCFLTSNSISLYLQLVLTWDRYTSELAKFAITATNFLSISFRYGLKFSVNRGDRCRFSSVVIKLKRTLRTCSHIFVRTF